MEHEQSQEFTTTRERKKRSEDCCGYRCLRGTEAVKSTQVPDQIGVGGTPNYLEVLAEAMVLIGPRDDEKHTRPRPPVCQGTINRELSK